MYFIKMYFTAPRSTFEAAIKMQNYAMLLCWLKTQ